MALAGVVAHSSSARTHDVSAAPPPDLHLQRYGRVAWCVHGQLLRLHREERYGVSYSYKENSSGKGECEDTWRVCRTSPGSSNDQQLRA